MSRQQVGAESIVTRTKQRPILKITRNSVQLSHQLAIAKPGFSGSTSYENTNQLLGYLLLELTFALPSTPQWNLIGRIHHRSGAGGTFNDVNGASNSVALGVKYLF